MYYIDTGYSNRLKLISYCYIENLPIRNKYISGISLLEYLENNYIFEQLNINIYKIHITEQNDPNRSCSYFEINELYIPLWNISINFERKTNILFNREDRYFIIPYQCNDKPEFLENKLISLDDSKELYNIVLAKLQHDKSTELLNSLLNEHEYLKYILE